MKKLIRIGIGIIILGFLAGYGPEIISGVCNLKATAEEKLEGRTWQSVIEDLKKWRKAAEETVDSIAKDVTGTSGETTGSSNPSVAATVESVIDGDTILVSVNGETRKVRLIGINAEESVHEDLTKNNSYGQSASDYLKGILKTGTPVWLEYDEAAHDIYNRDLCYVWLSEDMSDITFMLNAILLREGYVYVAIYTPNIRYADVFASIQEKAASEETGLWVYQEFRNAAGL